MTAREHRPGIVPTVFLAFRGGPDVEDELQFVVGRELWERVELVCDDLQVRLQSGSGSEPGCLTVCFIGQRVPADPLPAGNAFFYLRQSSTVDAVPPDCRSAYADDAPEVRAALERLARIDIPATMRPVRRYAARWSGAEGRLTELESRGTPLGEVVFLDLLRALLDAHPPSRR